MFHEPWAILCTKTRAFKDAYVIPEVMNEIMMNPNDVLVGVANQQLRLHSFREQRPRATLEILFIPVEVCEVVMNMMVGGGYPFGLWATNVPKIRAFKDAYVIPVEALDEMLMDPNVVLVGIPNQHYVCTPSENKGLEPHWR